MPSTDSMTIAPIASRYITSLKHPPSPPDLPVYYIHGFRWQRKDIRIHVILHNTEDAAPDYTMSTSSNTAMIASLLKTHPTLASSAPQLSMVEEYDPNDESAGQSVQPHAWVADKVIKGGEGIDARSALRQGVSAASWQVMTDLRDELAKGENVGWFVVYNGDPERNEGVRKGGEQQQQQQQQQRGSKQVGFVDARVFLDGSVVC